MNKLATVALLTIIGAAMGLVLLPGLATTTSPLTFYASGTIEASKMPINITCMPFTISTKPGDQHSKIITSWIKINRTQPEVSVVKLKIKLLDVDMLKKYFNYFVIVLNLTNEYKGRLTLKHPETTITIDADDWNGNTVTLGALVFYEVKEKCLFETLPIQVEVTALSVT